MRRYFWILSSLFLLSLAGAGDSAIWGPDMTDQVLALDLATGAEIAPEIVKIANPEGLKMPDGQELNKAVPLSAFPKKRGAPWQGALIWVVEAKPRQALKLRFRLGRIGGIRALAPERIPVEWNGAAVGALLPDPETLRERTGVEALLEVPAEKVLAQNTLRIAASHGEIGVAALYIEDQPSAVFATRSQQAGAFDAAAKELAPVPEVGQPLNGRVLLLSKGPGRSTEAFRRLVLDPLRVDVNEVSIQECPPSLWGAYKMVIVASWGLPPLLKEDVAEITDYVRNGGRLWMNAEGYLRMSRSIPNRAELEKELFGGAIARTQRDDLPEGISGYHDTRRGESPLAASIKGEPTTMMPVGGRLMTLSDGFPAKDAVLTLSMPTGKPRGITILRPLGKGWVLLDGFSHLQVETLPLARKLVQAALTDAPIFP